MIKKFLFIFVTVLMPCVLMAQSMSDDKVVQFVLDEQEKGASQQDIASQLLKKGVTAEQLRRVRKKYEAEKGQLGAVD
ncbi:MAG: hypothetical protein J6R36_04135, partial [Bacteroidaceae bacterium]|nr:hypothetical protein [Bacteroidaceae bacterium]